MTLLWHVEERQLKKSRPPSRTSRRRYRDVPPLPISPARVDWTIEASRLLRRRPPALGTSVCTCSTPTASRAEAADWRRRHKSPTRPSASGEGWDRVYYVPARPRPLGEHGGEPHGLRFTRPLRASRTAAVSRHLVHEHWDGSSRPRNVNYATRRLGDHEPYFSYGSGSPGDVSQARRGRLEVTLRS